MGLSRSINIIIIILLSISSNVHAAWQEPTEEVNGSWGNLPGQFVISYQDTHDIFPRTIAISSSGMVAVSEDQTVKRVQIFNDGSLVKVIDTFAFDLVFSESDLYVSGGGLRKYDATGDLVWSKEDVSFVSLQTSSNGNVIGYNRKENKYYIYSPTGDLLQTTTERPLELGRIEERSLGGGKYRATITYDDAVYSIYSTKEYERFVRDKNKNIYGILPALVEKYGLCGSLLGRLELPDPKVFKGEKVPGKEQYIFEHDRYGEPVLDVNGNVYTWKATPNNYSILKWTWQDDPNAPSDVPDAPTNLTVAAGTTGLTLRWKAPLQDPGCVSEYEIARSTVSQGAFTPVGTVPSGTFVYTDTTGEAGTTYYYKVRAKGGSGYSDYTNEASGQRN